MLFTIREKKDIKYQKYISNETDFQNERKINQMI